MSIVVRKLPLVVVKPSVPVMETGNINLSPYDMTHLTISATVILVFDHPIHEPIETIKRALSVALVHYHPFSGRLGDEAPHLRCTGEGASFLAASANCTINDMIKSLDHSLLQELVMCYPDDDVCRPGDPLVLMQVTEFSCGGFVVGITISHAVADGAGMGQFSQAIAELACGLSSPSVVPVRWDASLVDTVPTPSLLDIIHFFMDLQPFEMAKQDIHIPVSIISSIKHRFRGHSNGQGLSCTVFEIVAAVLWQCRTRTIMLDPDAPTALLFPVNARKYVGAKDGYYGNCITGQVVRATSGVVANGDIVDLVEMIRRAKDQILDQFNKDAESSLKQAAPVHGYNVFTISSTRGLGFDQVDFGSGRPARVMMSRRGRVNTPGCFILPSCQGQDDGVDIFSLFVKEQHLDAFRRELARFTALAMAKL